MAVSVPNIYAHPKTGILWVRKVVPAPLRTIVGKRELKASLGTRDPREAVTEAGPVLERFEAIIKAARMEHEGKAVSLNARETAVVLALAYRLKVAEHADDPGSPEMWDEFAGYYADMFEPDDDDGASGRRVFASDAHIRADVRAIFRAQGLVPDTSTMGRATEMWAREMLHLGREMEKRADGDWSGTLGTERLPKPSEATPAPAHVQVPIAEIVAGWARETSKVGKARYDRERTAAAFETFLGHGDASKVTADDVVRWKESRIAAGRSLKTVANDLNELSPVWKWAKRNRKLSYAENPFAGLAPLKKATSQRLRGPYTPDEAIRLLLAAREQTGLLRWLPWLLCFTGARLGEVVQADKQDMAPIVGLKGSWALHIHEEGPGRSLKTPQSRRYVPLHPALIREGFLAYLEGLPAGSPLFPAVGLDKFGTRKARAGYKHSKWVRGRVGITDTTKDPAHAWRHLWEDRARAAGMPQNVADALMGHLNAANEAEGYGRGFKFMPETTAAHVAAMGVPVA